MSYLLRKLLNIIHTEHKTWLHHCPGDWRDFTEVPKGERCPLCDKSELGYYPKSIPMRQWEWRESLDNIKKLK